MSYFSFPLSHSFISLSLLTASHPNPGGQRPSAQLSSLTSHLILSRPISSLLICSSNHNHHTHTNAHTCAHLHQTAPHPCQAQTPGLFEAVSVNDSSPLYCSVKPKVQLYKGFGTSVCVSTQECVNARSRLCDLAVVSMKLPMLNCEPGVGS